MSTSQIPKPPPPRPSRLGLFMALLVLLGVILLAVYEWFDYQDQKARLDQWKEVCNQLLGELQAKEKEFKEPINPDDLADLEARLNSELPKEIDLPALEARIRSQAESAGLSVLDVQTRLEKEERGYQVLPVRLRVVGTTDSLQKALKNFREDPAPLHQVRMAKEIANEEEGQPPDTKIEYDVYLDTAREPDLEELCRVEYERPSPIELRFNAISLLDPDVRNAGKIQEDMIAELDRTVDGAKKACAAQSKVMVLQKKLKTVTGLLKMLKK